MHVCLQGPIETVESVQRSPDRDGVCQYGVGKRQSAVEHLENRTSGRAQLGAHRTTGEIHPAAYPGKADDDGFIVEGYTNGEAKGP